MDANGEKKLEIIKVLENYLLAVPEEGYYVVMIALLARFNLEVHQVNNAQKYLSKYTELKSSIPGNFSDHPEIIASKAFALAFCNPGSYISKEVFKLYGDALEEKEDVDWLYGQCLALEKVSRLPGEDEDDLNRKLEKKLRKVIDMDPTHYQAMITLAKRLVMKEAFEEANDFIAKAEQSGKSAENFEDSATKLEMLGSLYQKGCMSKVNKDHLKKAIEKFQGALSVDKNSEKAIHGYSKCLLQMFLNTKKKKDDINLNEAKEKMQKLQDSMFIPHLLTRAQILTEQALLKRDKKLFSDAEIIFEKIIQMTKDKKGKVFQLCEGYWHFSVFFQKYGKMMKSDDALKKEIKCLEDCIETDLQGEYEHSCSYAVKAQTQLLNYSTLELRDRTGKHMTAGIALEFKSKFFSIDEDYDTAIYYMRKALEENDQARILSQTENLIGLLLDATQKTNDIKSLGEAKDLMKALEDGPEKKRLQHEVNQ